MASDLDRAYIINGDDLRIALARRQWTLTKAATPVGGGDFTGRLKMPEEVVRAVLDEIGKPLDEVRRTMTRGELETRLSLALTAVKVVIKPEIELFTLQGTPIHSFRYPVADPGRVAADLLDDIETRGIDDGDEELVYEVGRPAQLDPECAVDGPRCDRVGGPCTCPALDAPEPCPFHLGNGAAGECNCELKKYALAAPGTRIDADLCASCGNQFPPGQVCNGCHAQPLEDPELIAAQQVLDALAPLETADPAAVLRVLRWARERYDT